MLSRSEHLSRHQLNRKTLQCRGPWLIWTDYGRTLECEQCGKKFARRYHLPAPLNFSMMMLIARRAATSSIDTSTVIAINSKRSIQPMLRDPPSTLPSPKISRLPMREILAQFGRYQPNRFLDQSSGIRPPPLSSTPTITLQATRSNPSSPLLPMHPGG